MAFTKETNRAVMCKGTWPEDDCADFLVFYCKKDETNEQAIVRAQAAYSPDESFYVVDE